MQPRLTRSRADATSRIANGTLYAGPVAWADEKATISDTAAPLCPSLRLREKARAKAIEEWAGSTHGGEDWTLDARCGAKELV